MSEVTTAEITDTTTSVTNAPIGDGPARPWGETPNTAGVPDPAAPLGPVDANPPVPANPTDPLPAGLNANPENRPAGVSAEAERSNDAVGGRGYNSGVAPSNPDGAGQRRDLPPLDAFQAEILQRFHDLQPLEQIHLLDMKGLSSKGSLAVLANRFLRYEVGNHYGYDKVDWNPNVDPLQSHPVTLAGYRANPAADDTLPQQPTAADRTSSPVPPPPVPPVNPYRSFLQSGQSFGRFRDPISMDPLGDWSMNGSSVHLSQTTHPQPAGQHVTFGPTSYAPITTASPPAHQGPTPTTTTPPLNQPPLFRPSTQPVPRGNSTYRVDGTRTSQVYGTIPTTVAAANPGGLAPPPTIGHITSAANGGQFYILTTSGYVPLTTAGPAPPTTAGYVPPAATVHQPSPAVVPPQWTNTSPYGTPLPPAQPNLAQTYNASQFAPAQSQYLTDSRLNPFSDFHKIIAAFRRPDFVFSGAAGEDPFSFLERLEESVGTYNLTEEEILRALPSALKDHAATWYRTERKFVTSYQEFMEVFQETFCPAERIESLWQDIRRRTQGENETMRDYIICMKGLFSQIHPTPPLTHQLNLVYSQLHPTYLRQISRQQVSSYSDLMRIGKDIERKLESISRYRPPPLPEDSFSPNFACRIPIAAKGRKQGHAAHAHAAQAQPPAAPAGQAVEQTYAQVVQSNYRPPAQTYNPHPYAPPADSSKIPALMDLPRSPPTAAPPSPPQNLQSRGTLGQCYRCGGWDHFAKACHLPPPAHWRQNYQPSFPPRVPPNYQDVPQQTPLAGNQWTPPPINYQYHPQYNPQPAGPSQQTNGYSPISYPSAQQTGQPSAGLGNESGGRV